MARIGRTGALPWAAAIPLHPSLTTNPMTTMPARKNDAPSSVGDRSPSYHEPASVDQLTERNVKTIAELEKAAQSHQTSADRVSDRITRFCGSMPFVWVHVIWFTVWILGNTEFLSKPIDPYPFSFLTLVVSLEAIFLSTFIMISENRQGRIDERRSHLDLQINLLAEQENTKTLKLLEAIALKMGVDPSDDPDVEILEQATRPEALIAQIDESLQTMEKPSASDTP
jgi:uncharacterized membrane protein